MKRSLSVDNAAAKLQLGMTEMSGMSLRKTIGVVMLSI